MLVQGSGRLLLQQGREGWLVGDVFDPFFDIKNQKSSLTFLFLSCCLPYCTSVPGLSCQKYPIYRYPLTVLLYFFISIDYKSGSRLFPLRNPIIDDEEEKRQRQSEQQR